MNVPQEINQTDNLSLSDKANDIGGVPPSIQSTSVTCSNLQYLIEDCLLKIFSVNKLDLMDLCSLAETCKRFKEIAKRVIPNEVSVTIGNNFVVKAAGYSRVTVYESEVQRIFKNFGWSLLAVTIHGDKKYFTGLDVVRKLKVGWEVDFATSDNNSTLQGFKYRKYSVTKISESIGNDLTLKLLVALILRYTTLETHHLLYFEHDSGSKTVILQATGNTIYNIPDLKLWKDDMGTMITVAKRHSVESLKSSLDDLKFLLPLGDLRELTLQWCHLPKDSKLFASMIQLRKLEMKWCEFVDTSNVVGIISQLKNLEKLTIVRSWLESNVFFKLNEETFREIVRIVNGRPNVLNLVCAINFELKSIDENMNVTLNLPVKK